MIPAKDLEPILATWRNQVHYAIESGDAPDLALGSSDEVLTTLVGQEALRAIADSRTDMTEPIVSAGGAAGVWLAALLLPVDRAPHDVQDVRPVRAAAPGWLTLYTGVDAATHVASGLTLPQHPNRLRPPGSRGVPGGFADSIAPTLRPATPTTWENLPLRTLASGASPLGLRSAGAWCGWLALLLCLLLVAGAILS